jgi:hypothetical protein
LGNRTICGKEALRVSWRFGTLHLSLAVAGRAEVPLIAWSRPAAELIRVLLPKLPASLTDRFVRHNDSTSEPELFDIALAEAKTEVQPDIMADDLRGEAVVFI